MKREDHECNNASHTDRRIGAVDYLESAFSTNVRRMSVNRCVVRS
jgi:hypothetical protein